MLNFLRDTKLGRYATELVALGTIYSTTPVFSQQPDSTMVNVGGYTMSAKVRDEICTLYAAFSDAEKGGDNFLVGLTSEKPGYKIHYVPAGFDPKNLKESVAVVQFKLADTDGDKDIDANEFSGYCTKIADQIGEQQRNNMNNRGKKSQ